ARMSKTMISREILMEAASFASGIKLKTNKKKVPFCVRVDNDRIKVTPQTNKERSIPNHEVVAFCDLYNKTLSMKRNDYKEMRNTSYLLALVSILEELQPSEEEAITSLKEGKQTTSVATRYERNALARKLCLEFHGYSCKICDFNFEKVYGARGNGFIHVHHIKPLSEISREHVVDPEADLVPVCPNCHAMLHRYEDIMPEELINLMCQKCT
ncbi:TPA: hypothetical protein I7232_22170, partial [Vibrio vulnificus]|nr:hypothetical protein [Vibrio vulnificus]HDY7608257.1 HNH endonuclease [Vibrio vulnificus]